MKIIHCGDIHLDSKLSAVFDREQAKERRNEILYRFTEMVEFADRNGVTCVLICGDLFDTKTVSAMTMSTLKRCFLAHPDISFYYIRGNHDEAVYVAELMELDNFFSFCKDWEVYSLGEHDRIRLYGAEIDGHNNRELLDGFTADSNYINLVMLHGQECATESDGPDDLDLRLLKDKNIDYLALGHIHTYLRHNLDARGICIYSGCLEPRGFDEPGDHGFVLLDIDEDRGTFTDEFVSFSKRRLWEVYVDVSNVYDNSEIIDRVEDKLKVFKYPSRDLVKVILTGSFNVEMDKNFEYIKTVFSSYYYAFKVEDETKPYIDFEKYALDESLKGEFVRLCMAEDLDEQARGEILRLGLTAIFGGELR